MVSKYARALDEILDAVIKSEHVKYEHERTDLMDNTKARILKEYELRKFEYRLLLEKLQEDGCIKVDDWIFENCSSTFKGRDYSLRGGYKKVNKIEWWNLLFKRATSGLLVGGAIATIAIAYFESVKFSERNSLKSDRIEKTIPDTSSAKVKQALPSKAVAIPLKDTGSHSLQYTPQNQADSLIRLNMKKSCN